jgi:hypothetical protein
MILEKSFIDGCIIGTRIRTSSAARGAANRGKEGDPG